MKYTRILLKLSGEALKENDTDLFSVDLIKKLGDTLKELTNKGVKIGIVVGGGNIFRGRVSEQFNLDRVLSDKMGMLATNINGLLLNNVFNQNGIDCALMSAMPVPGVVEDIIVKEANTNLDEGKIVIFAGGTGKPYFSTDTAASLRAIDIKADVILACKNGIDGFYSDDPRNNPNAKFLPFLTYDEILEKKLNAMDLDSIKICKENNIEIRVFNMNDLNNIIKVCEGDNIGTRIGKE